VINGYSQGIVTMQRCDGNF